MYFQGESEREVVRVTLECCLAERAWNPYYAHLLAALAAAAKGHRITLQFCLWAKFKQARAIAAAPPAAACMLSCSRDACKHAEEASAILPSTAELVWV